MRALLEIRLLVLASATALVTASTSMAVPIAFIGELSVVLPSLPFVVTVEGSGIAEANAANGGALTSLALPASAFATATDFPGTGIIGGVHVNAKNGAGSFSLTPAGGGGQMPIAGVVRLCLFSPCASAGASLDLPLGVIGAGGTTAVAGPPSVTLVGAGWTKGQITVTNPGLVTQVSGHGAGPSALAGTTAQPGGTLWLVAPIRVRSSLCRGSKTSAPTAS